MNMQRITTFGEQDVLCGRGGGTLRHPGNKKYRSLIKSSKPVYLISSKNEKTAISRSIVAAIRKNNGRFLERSKDLQSWYDIGDAKATEKTSQALREGQPKLRKKMIDHGIISDDLAQCSTEHMISLLPTASNTQIDPKTIEPNPIEPNAVFGDNSYSSVNKNDIQTNTINRQRAMLEQSLNRVFSDIKPIMDERHAIGNCRFHPTDCPENSASCQFDRPQTRIVTPPTTPPNYPQQPVERIEIDMGSFRRPFPENQDMIISNTMHTTDFDDSNSIMTFEMDDDEMIDDDDDQAILPVSTPSPPMTNHFRALNELKSNVPIYDNDGDRTMFSNPPSTIVSPITNHLRALTELRDNVPIYPSSGFKNNVQNHPANNFQQFNGNTSRNNLNTSCSSINFAPNLVFPKQAGF